MTFAIRRLDLDDPTDVALGRGLVEEYMFFTLDEMREATGAAPEPDVVARLVPDLRDFAARYRDGGYLLAMVGDAPAGGVGVTDLSGGVCEMNRLWLRPAHQGAGRGRALVDACIALARARGYRRMVLDVSPYRTRAIALYHSVGFVDSEPVHEYPFPMVPLALDLER